jgi:hypothetical protein
MQHRDRRSKGEVCRAPFRLASADRNSHFRGRLVLLFIADNDDDDKCPRSPCAAAERKRQRERSLGSRFDERRAELLSHHGSGQRDLRGGNAGTVGERHLHPPDREGSVRRRLNVQTHRSDERRNGRTGWLADGLRRDDRRLNAYRSRKIGPEWRRVEHPFFRITPNRYP